MDKEDSTNSSTVTKQSDDKSLKVTYKGYETTINTETGSMTALAKAGETPVTPTPTSSTVVKIGTTDISSITGFNYSEGLKEYYGETTDFKSAESGDLSTIDWQLFYDDKDNIYLIASESVPNATLPNRIKTTSRFADEDTAWTGEYTGYILQNSPWKEGCNSTIFQNNQFVQNYLKIVASINTNCPSQSDIASMKAIAYMLDSNEWNHFAGGFSEVTAMGGPTIEMFALSYNAAHPNGVKLGTYGEINMEDYPDPNAEEYIQPNTNYLGYYVKVGDSDWYTYFNSSDLENRKYVVQ